eukprot:jgi/Ulvmu1/6802/UM031_0003.1
MRNDFCYGLRGAGRASQCFPQGRHCGRTRVHAKGQYAVRLTDCRSSMDANGTANHTVTSESSKELHAELAAPSTAHALLDPSFNSAPPPEQAPHLVVFSGGTAFNSIAGYMCKQFPRVTHVLPVSDDGGSTAEIVRVLGGPAVGDIRSRCLRLADEGSTEARAVKALLGHRLSAHDPEAAKTEWYNIVEGEHALWQGVSDPYKHTIRAFLVHFHTLVLRQSSARFSFRNGSVGNFFFAGARMFFRSLDAAIFLFSRVARLPLGSAVVPAISTEERITLGAELADGSRLRGQNMISHPPAQRSAQIVEKDGDHVPLPAAVRRVFYLATEGTHREHEVQLPANSVALAALGRADAVVYAVGSLYTSIAPSLALRGVGEAVAQRTGPKVLLLNGCHDRETSRCLRHDGPMDAVDYVLAITSALNREGGRGTVLHHPPAAYVDTLLVPEGCTVRVDDAALGALGVSAVERVQSHKDSSGCSLFDRERLIAAFQRRFAHLEPQDTSVL